jgi:bifunctional DNA-binding transcriptional regulator/antitoxin component of YhaV-PrlF toxin-antitoxin module
MRVPAPKLAMGGDLRPGRPPPWLAVFVHGDLVARFDGAVEAVAVVLADVRTCRRRCRWLGRVRLRVPRCVVPCRSGKIQCSVTATGNAKVSHRGQTSLPAELRHRWGIDGGGEVGFIDLGDAALIVPGGVAAARSQLRRVLKHRYDVGLASIADPELADQ